MYKNLGKIQSTYIIVTNKIVVHVNTFFNTSFEIYTLIETNIDNFTFLVWQMIVSLSVHVVY